MKLTDLRNSDRLPARFWSKVDMSGGEDACWPWTGSRDTSGYGQIGVKLADGRERPIRAQRVAFLLTHGEIDDSLDTCHSCDFPPCCNPRHLWQGTRKQNLQDMVAKGRHHTATGAYRPLPELVQGELNPQAKLTADHVIAIRRRHASGELQKDIALDLGVHKATINDIVLRKKWKHLT